MAYRDALASICIGGLRISSIRDELVEQEAKVLSAFEKALGASSSTNSRQLKLFRAPPMQVHTTASREVFRARFESKTKKGGQLFKFSG